MAAVAVEGGALMELARGCGKADGCAGRGAGAAVAVVVFVVGRGAAGGAAAAARAGGASYRGALGAGML